MRRRLIGFGLVAVALAGIVGAAVRSGGGSGGDASTTAVGGAGGEAESSLDVAARAPAPAPFDRSVSDIPILSTSADLVQPRIVKTAKLSLRVAEGSFQNRFHEVADIAAANGGFVSSSETSGVGARSGSLRLRVPAARFEEALGELKALGRVTAETVSGRDVSLAFVDLEARLRNWEAQETVLLRLMRRATTVDASVKVQRRLQDVQLAIEQIRGQLRVLSDQTEMSSISVSMKEAGIAPKVAPGTLSKAWGQAVHGFVAVVAAIVVGFGYLLPLALLGLVLVAAVMALRRLRTRLA